MAALSIHHHILGNKYKSWLIMAFFILFISTLGYALGRAIGYSKSFLALAFGLSAIVSLASFYLGDQLILAVSGAKLAERKKDFELYALVENIAASAGLPKPKVYLIEDSAPNALAIGCHPSRGGICLTRGLVEKLNKTELEAVIAHEISHIKNYDSRLMMIVAVLIGMVVYLSEWLFKRNKFTLIFSLLGVALAITAPFSASLIQLTISRRREYFADAKAVLLTHYAEGLAHALEKIGKSEEVLKTASNATAHLFIVNPFEDKRIGQRFSSLFNTHPPIEERIRLLKGM